MFKSKMFAVLVLLAVALTASNDVLAQSSESLVNSVWTGTGPSAHSSDGVSYVFHFNDGELSLKSTCTSDSISSSMTLSVPVAYSENGATVQLKSGISAQIPAGHDRCSVNFPANLEFHLENAKVFMLYAGQRRVTGLKRQLPN